MARKQIDPYSVTGPGLDPAPTYESSGAALSRSLTAALAWHGEGAWYAPPLPVVVHSAVGAGDSFVAGMVWALSGGFSAVDAFARGVACATATLVSVSSGLGDSAQVLELLQQVRCIDNFDNASLPL